MAKPTVLIALSDDIEIGAQAKTEICLMKEGENKYSIGGKESSFSTTIEDMDKMVETCNTRGKEICIDYDHATLNEESSHQGNAEAGGWCKSLERRGKELYATGIEWLDKAKTQIEDKAYKYFSPVIEFDDSTGNPKEIHSIGITNHPALHNCPKLLTAMNDTMLANLDNDNEVFNLEDEEDDYVDTSDLNTQVAEELSEIDKQKQILEDAKIDKENKARDLEIAEKKVLLEELKRISTESNKSVNDLINDLYAMAKGESETEEIKAFCDTLFEKDTDFEKLYLALNDNKLDGIKRLALADMQKSEIESLEQSIDTIGREKKSLQLSFNDSRRKLSSYKSLVGLSATDTTKAFNDKINSLQESEKQLNRLLKLNDCKSVDEVNEKIVRQKNDFNAKLEVQAKRFEVDSVVKQAFNDGKITMGQKQWAKDYADRDLKGFNDWLGSTPVIFKDIQGLTSALNDNEKKLGGEYFNALTESEKENIIDISSKTKQDIEVVAKAYTEHQ